MVHAEQSEEFNNVENILVIVFNAYFEVPYHGKDHNDYVNGAGFCCEGKDKKLQAYGEGIGKGNEEYEKMQYYYHADHLRNY